MNKIAIVSTIQPETHYTRYLYKGLKQANVSVFLLVDDIPENFEYVRNLKDKNVVVLWKKGITLPLKILFFALRKHLKVIHLQHEFNMYGGIVGVPFFLLTLALLKCFGKKIAITSHAVINSNDVDEDFLEVFALSKYKGAKKMIKYAFYWFFKLMGLLADIIIVHSQFTKDVYKATYRISDEKVVVIPIGITSDAQKAGAACTVVSTAAWMNSIESKRIILFFGYLLHRKGIDLLIDAYADLYEQGKLDDSVLVLAGGSLSNQQEYVEYLKELARKREVEKNVVFTGFLNEKEISYLYSRSEFVVLPYTHSVSSSMPLSLAFQFSKPVIVSDIGTLRDEVEEGVNGLFFENKDRNDLKDKIRLLYSDTNLLNRLKLGTQSEVYKRSWVNVAKTTHSLVYERLLQNESF
ncbi:MAG: glycosyltransferase family 4 protein [Patescibacteria group bacterium]|jgi:glycosyltransferase involved in cell wall biosynthesis